VPDGARRCRRPRRCIGACGATSRSANSEWALLEELLPSGAALCRGVLQSAASPFVQRQLLLIGALMDLKDEAGRRMLSTLLRNTLGVLSTEEQLIRADDGAARQRFTPSEDEYTHDRARDNVGRQGRARAVRAARGAGDAGCGGERSCAPTRRSWPNWRARHHRGGRRRRVQALVAETAELRAQEELRAQLEEGTWLRCMSLASTLLQNTTKARPATRASAACGTRFWPPCATPTRWCARPACAPPASLR
jgi:hypothetical protein